MLEQEISNLLRTTSSGMTIDEMEIGLEKQGKSIIPGVVECLLLLSGNFTEKTERWFPQTNDKSVAVLEVIQRYARESGRRIFKAEAALCDLPNDLKPTREELAHILQSSNKYGLLKNDMIRQKD